MTEIVIDKKKYVLIPEQEYKVLQKKAALKAGREETLSINKARVYSRNLINLFSTHFC